jgi:hypothetical protein
MVRDVMLRCMPGAAVTLRIATAAVLLSGMDSCTLGVTWPLGTAIPILHSRIALAAMHPGEYGITAPQMKQAHAEYAGNLRFSCVLASAPSDPPLHSRPCR